MSHLIIQPLAAADPLAAIIFFLIWGAIAVISQYNKWRQKQQQEQLRQPPPLPPLTGTQQQFPSRAPAPRGVPLPTLRRVAKRPALTPKARPQPQQKAPLPKRAVAQTPAARKPQQAIRQPPVVVPQAEDQAYAHSRSSEALTRQMAKGIAGAGAGGVQHAPPAVSVSELRSMVRPPNLRKQYILTELLQPPLGLRTPEH